MDEQIEQGISVTELIDQTYNKLVEKYSTDQITFETPIHTEIADDSDGHRTRKGYMEYTKIDILTIDGNTWFVGKGEPAGAYPCQGYTNDIFATNFKGALYHHDVKILIQFKFSRYFPPGDVIEEDDPDEVKELKGLFPPERGPPPQTIEFLECVEKGELGPDTPNIEYGLRAVIESGCYFSSSLLHGETFNELKARSEGRFKDKMPEIVERIKKEYGIWLGAYDDYFGKTHKNEDGIDSVYLVSPTYKPEAVDYLVEQIGTILKE
jgi:hypothetical protein